MKQLTYHHDAYARGYIKAGHEYEEYYNGRFGEGVKRHRRAHNTTNYHVVEYWVYKEEDE